MQLETYQIFSVFLYTVRISTQDGTKLFQQQVKIPEENILEGLYGAHDAALHLSDLFNVSLQGDAIQDFVTRGDQALLSANEVPGENVLESLNKIEIRDSVQPQTVLAMYNQDILIEIEQCQAIKD